MRDYDRDYRELYRGIPMKPVREHEESLDPNYRGGGYHGMRMQPGRPGQAAYGDYRFEHRDDLGRYGGYDGRYDAGPGRMDEHGIFRDPFDRDPGRYAGTRWGPRPEDYGREERSGVSRDLRYLRQYNSQSPALRGGRAYDRSYGRAEGEPGRHPGEGTPTRDDYSRESNRYGGRSPEGFSQGWLPRQAPRGSQASRR